MSKADTSRIFHQNKDRLIPRREGPRQSRPHLPSLRWSGCLLDRLVMSAFVWAMAFTWVFFREAGGYPSLMRINAPSVKRVVI